MKGRVAGTAVALLAVAAVVGFVAWSPIVVPATGAAMRAALVDTRPVPTLAPGEVSTYTVRFRNVGLVAWQKGTSKEVLLGVRDDDPATTAQIASGWATPTRITSTLESFVIPGAIGTFVFAVRAPQTPGVYKVPVGLVADALGWLGEDLVELVVTSDLGFHAELVEQSLHPTLRPGEASGPLTVRVRNRGAKTWLRGTEGQQVNLGLAGDERAMSGLAMGWPSPDRVAVQTEPRVGPGGIATFVFRVRAPATPGVYPLKLRPVVDGVTWLEDAGIVSLVTVGGASDVVPAAADPQARGASPLRTTFAFAAASDPRVVVRGGTANITATFTSSVAVSAVVGVTVYAPGGSSVVYQKWFEKESFASDVSRSFTVPWTVSSAAALGTYRVSVTAYSNNWKALYGSMSDAAVVEVVQPAAPTSSPTPNPTDSVTVPPGATPPPATTAPTPTTIAPTPAPTSTVAPARPTFAQTATVSPASVAQGGTVTITASFTADQATSAIVSIYVYAPGGTAELDQQYFEDQSFVAGETRTYTVTWQVPASAGAGTYVVKLGTFPPAWQLHYTWTDLAATFSVTAGATPTPAFTQSASASPASVAQGGTVTITASFTATVGGTAITSVYVFAPDSTTQLMQQWFDDQVFATGQTRTYTVTWQAPATAGAGTYIVKLGTFPPGWSGQHYSWTDRAATFSVNAPAPTATPTAAPTAPPTAPPTVAPTATPTAQPTTAPQLLAVNDTSFSYAGTWLTSTGAAKYQTDDHHSDVTGSTYSVTFNGTSLRIFGARAPYHGIAAVSVDGGPESDVDLYAPTRADQALLFTTPTLANATHTVRVRVTGRKNPASTEFIVNADRADIEGTLVAPPPTPVPTLAPTPAPTTPPTFSGLHVEGNRLANAQGQTVVLRGVDRMGLEYMCVQAGGLADGPVDQASVNAMRTWRNSNAVRVPLNEHCWLGVSGTPRGATYQQGVENYVNLLTSSGMYVILDLHWSAPAGQVATGQQAMPNTSYSAEFWRSVASRFKSNPMVLFDLFNEPIPNNNANDGTDAAAMRSWSCWRDGGASGNCDVTLSLSVGTSMSGSQAVGMQTLVDAVRSTGAQNVIVLGGIQWADTIWSNSSRNLWAYRPSDPLGQLVASLHSYDGTWCPDTACFDREVTPIAANMPVIFGEFGNAAGATPLDALMSWADAHGVGYLAWTWAVSSSGFSQYKLIASWDGTPNLFGQVVKGHLAALP